MKFSYNWLKDYFSSLPPPQKVAELLLMHSFEVEGVEKKGRDTVFSIDILPNRIADASGHRGVAGELSAILQKPCKIPKRSFKEISEPVAGLIRVDVKDKQGCPRYAARMMRDIHVGPAPAWLKERLLACGINSINSVVDIANYVMLDMVQPLHVFDADKIAGSIIVRRAKESEQFITLDGETYTLDAHDLVIADNEGILALAGIKGGKRAEIDENTKNIIIESANFDPESIELTAKRVNLLTDAAVRFRVGIDPNLTVRAGNEAVSLIQEIAGGKILRGAVDTGKNIPERIIGVRAQKANSVLGIILTEKEMISIFKRLGFGVTKQKKYMKVRVPSVRVDLRVEEDLIEELARMYGLANIKPISPHITFGEAGDTLREKFRERARDRIAALGYSEIYSYAFAGEREKELAKGQGEVLALLNPLRPDMKYLRPHLTGSLLSAFEKNRQQDGMRVFEMGNIFLRSANSIRDTAELEEEHIALGFLTKDLRISPFFELKGIVSALFESFGIDDMYFDVADAGLSRLFHPFRYAHIKTDGKTIGILGELHPRVRDTFGIRGAGGVVELSFTKLFEAASAEIRYKEVSKYPSVMRDIALLVPLDTRVAEVEDIIENTGGPLLADTDLIDLYEGAELPDGKKNFAFRLVFQAPDRTLKDKEVNVIVEKITKTLETNLEWEVR